MNVGQERRSRREEEGVGGRCLQSTAACLQRVAVEKCGIVSTGVRLQLTGT